MAQDDDGSSLRREHWVCFDIVYPAVEAVSRASRVSDAGKGKDDDGSHGKATYEYLGVLRRLPYAMAESGHAGWTFGAAELEKGFLSQGSSGANVLRRE